MKAKKSQKLSPRHRSFVAEYLKDRNATQAYIRVYGGSQKVAEGSGPRLLGNARVKEAIEKGLARLADRANITAERNIQRIAEIAYHDKKAARRDVLKACELIGKTFGQFVDVVQAEVGATVMTVDEAQVKAAFERVKKDY